MEGEYGAVVHNARGVDCWHRFVGSEIPDDGGGRLGADIFLRLCIVQCRGVDDSISPRKEKRKTIKNEIPIATRYACAGGVLREFE